MEDRRWCSSKCLDGRQCHCRRRRYETTYVVRARRLKLSITQWHKEKKNVNQMNEKTKIPQKNLELFAIQKGPSGN
jgi:hypothetical protein